MSKIRVLIVDDSSVMRSLLTKIFKFDADIEVVGTAPDPYVAREAIIKLKPDVMTLDVEMPRMDGITFLEKVMEHFPIRTIILSSLSTKNSETALRALDAGAIEVMAKPAIDLQNGIEAMSAEIVKVVKQVAQARLPAWAGQGPGKRPKFNTSTKPKLATTALAKTTHSVIAIASSTGGTEALKHILPLLPSDTPGILVTQHMPPGFTKAYAELMNKICEMEVKEAEDGDTVLPGRVLLAPGNFHMELCRSGAKYFVKLHQEPLLHGVRPAADFMMKSVAKYAGANAVGIVLTGMGKDGAEGLKAMHDAGAYTIAQDEKTCIVYGMPKVAVEMGAIDKVLPLDEIINELRHQVKLKDVA